MNEAESNNDGKERGEYECTKANDIHDGEGEDTQHDPEAGKETIGEKERSEKCGGGAEPVEDTEKRGEGIFVWELGGDGS